jgi:Ohr subfamily peroxiredoxin
MSQEHDAGPTRVLYWAEATADGGRAGHARSSDGRLDVDLAVPSDMGGAGGTGTNPEQLFAAGYAACFQSSLFAVGSHLDLTDSRITARVGLGPTGHGGFGLTVSLDLHAPHLARPDAVGAMARAHQRCPYSNATRRNIPVILLVDGTPIEAWAAT